MKWPKALLLALMLCLTCAAGNAATYYVDSGATGSNNGSSWANAWTSLTAISGVAAGDTVYISGGPSGSTRSYSSSNWSPKGGNSSSSITYQIGQDSSHNGTAVFNIGGGTWLGAISYVTLSGNAGDGQMHYQLSNCGYVANLGGCANVTISYVNMGQVTEGNGSGGGVIDANPITGLQIDHCYCVVWDLVSDHFSYVLSNAGEYDANRAFNNTIYLPKGPYGYGADCFQWNGGGASIHDNYVAGYITNYNGSQHQDGVQPTSGSYIKIYNNTFRDMGNSGIFLDGYWGNFVNCQIYNNLIYLSIAVPSGAYPRGMDIISDDAAVSGPITFENVIVCNNLVANYPSLYGLGFYAPATGNGSVYINDVVANNVCYNTESGFDIDSSSGLANFNNLYIPSGNGSSFVSYTPISSSSAATTFDFHLVASDTQLRNKGSNLFTYFTIDKDNNTRPASGPWDLGAYQYGSTGSTGGTSPTNTSYQAPVVNVTQNATDVDPNTTGTQVYPGTTVQYSGSATSPVGNPLTWKWLYSTNGSSNVVFQTGSGTVLPVSYLFTTNNIGNTFVWTLQVNDGVTNVQAQISTIVEAAPTPGTSLTFQAPNGTLTGPFTVTGSYISQSVLTTVVSNAGQATFTFSITNAGTYVIQALVNAPNDSANSFYVNIDGTPVDPSMCWDIQPYTSGFEQRLVSWRGIGTETANQYNPKLFTLTAGVHQIIFAGREAGTELQSFSLLKVPQPPQGLQVVATP